MRWFISLILFVACCADAAHVITTSGRQINGAEISATADGSVTLTTATGQTMTFRKGQYRSAATDRPKELARAEELIEAGEGERAVPLLKNVKKECRFLAWDQRAIELLADHYFQTGRFAAAAAEFQLLDVQSPEVSRKAREAMIQSGDAEIVLKALNEDIAHGDRAAAAKAYLTRGDLKITAGDEDGARSDWLKVALFFKAQREEAALAEEKLKE